MGVSASAAAAATSSPHSAADGGEEAPSRSLEELRHECVELGLDFTAQSTREELADLVREYRANKPRGKPSMWKLATESYEELVCAIIRPPRANDYTVDDSLGQKQFRIGGLPHERLDFTLQNDRGQQLKCSWWRERAFSTLAPCCIYLHGNSSCRAEAVEVVKPLLQSGISVVAFDFSGSGLSEGDYVSLGFYETMDLQCVIAHLRQETNRVSTIGLWGRSMGAVTALMLAELDPSICCIVCDSPFSSLRRLARELVETNDLQVPKFALGLGLRMVRSSVKSRAKFDINCLEVIDQVDKCFVPCLFACADGDRFILPQHAADIHARYAGDKNLVRFPGDHNSPRPKFFFDSALIFLQNGMNAGGGGASGGGGGASDFQPEQRYVMPAPMHHHHHHHTHQAHHHGAHEDEDDEDEEAELQRALMLSMQAQ